MAHFAAAAHSARVGFLVVSWFHAALGRELHHCRFESFGAVVDLSLVCWCIGMMGHAPYQSYPCYAVCCGVLCSVLWRAMQCAVACYAVCYGVLCGVLWRAMQCAMACYAVCCGVLCSVLWRTMQCYPSVQCIVLLWHAIGRAGFGLVRLGYSVVPVCLCCCAAGHIFV
jgi:hypothetical protein